MRSTLVSLLFSSHFGCHHMLFCVTSFLQRYGKRCQITKSHRLTTAGRYRYVKSYCITELNELDIAIAAEEWQSYFGTEKSEKVTQKKISDGKNNLFPRFRECALRPVAVNHKCSLRDCSHSSSPFDNRLGGDLIILQMWKKTFGANVKCWAIGDKNGQNAGALQFAFMPHQ